MTKASDFKDHSRETRIIKGRAWFAFAVVIALIALLLSRLFTLQVLEYDTYRTQADSNRISTEPVAPTRGLIFDRDGRLLADNQPSYAVTLLKERIKAKNIDATIAKIATIIPISEAQIKRFKKRLAARRRPHTSVALRTRLNEHEIAQIAARLHELKGVQIEAALVRHYPHNDLLAHTLGYVGRINERELKKVDPDNYRATNHIGKTGLEKFYETQLHGKVGYQSVETSASGRIMRVLSSTPPTPGKNLQLYLDLPTQRAAMQALGDRLGAVVAIDPNTGGILAMASTPTFNPNLFVTGIDHATFNSLNHSEDRPLINRSLQGQYPPGSTIKPLIALSALNAGTANWQHTINDRGWYRLENDTRRYRDWKRGGHGDAVDLAYAIMQSCDTYFYELAFNTGIDIIHNFLTPFGLGKKTHIDMANEWRGLIPSREWKRRTQNLKWYPGETLNSGIGQGYMLTTPLQLALSTAILANRGRIIHPKMVKTLGDEPLSDTPSNASQAGTQIALRDTQDWERVIESMRNVVHHPRGTATGIAKELTDYDIAGKTGTAQVRGIKQNEEYDADAIAEKHRDHALFVGFAPVHNPQIAVAAIVENGGSGGSQAAPVVRAVMDAYLTPAATQATQADTATQASAHE